MNDRLPPRATQALERRYRDSVEPLELGRLMAGRTRRQALLPNFTGAERRVSVRLPTPRTRLQFAAAVGKLRQARRQASRWLQLQKSCPAIDSQVRNLFGAVSAHWTDDERHVLPMSPFPAQDSEPAQSKQGRQHRARFGRRRDGNIVKVPECRRLDEAKR
jgi:hypothetical protein